MILALKASKLAKVSTAYTVYCGTPGEEKNNIKNTRSLDKTRCNVVDFFALLEKIVTILNMRPIGKRFLVHTAALALLILP